MGAEKNSILLDSLKRMDILLLNGNGNSALHTHMTHISTKPEIHPPQQRRSRDTLERILSATEALLCEKEFAQITIADIVERADSSVGAFYKRFANKDALLPYLMHRHLQEQARIASAFYKKDWVSIPLAGRVSQLFTNAMNIADARRGLLRALMVRQFLDPASLTQAERDLTNEIFDLIVDWLTQCRDEISHPNPTTAARMAVFIGMTMIQHRQFCADSPRTQAVQLTDEQFIEELVRSTIHYLCAPSLSPNSSGENL